MLFKEWEYCNKGDNSVIKLDVYFTGLSPFKYNVDTRLQENSLRNARRVRLWHTNSEAQDQHNTPSILF